MMRHFRTDDPRTNPAIRFDGELPPRRGRRVVESSAPRPRPAAKRKADTNPTSLTTLTRPQPKRDPVRDAKDVTNAKRDEALARIRRQYQEAKR